MITTILICNALYCWTPAQRPVDTVDACRQRPVAGPVVPSTGRKCKSVDRYFTPRPKATRGGFKTSKGVIK